MAAEPPPSRFEQALRSGDWTVLDRGYDERESLSVDERKELAKVFDRAGKNPPWEQSSKSEK